ncbi:MAG: hypothetical protein COX57_09055 [Alphaproteobacteria bacterium CG_4_10_14_0_2_um_filter_63_37]|nr:MAG: hypothetical protein AUJ55_08955 [Proteobacteria bacterium CG1_02_64_396]PJA24296.1 MAG: hypothetical protein COX57_09055 [Alphaproteobacteria bacterium CG_4_10_14_0_2_um_filter_63_37]
MNLPLPLKLTLRELRRPGRSLRVMMLAVTVGVAALTAVAGFAERVDLALQQRSAQLLGGDVRISAGRDLRPLAQSLPPALHPQTTVVELRTMAVAGDRLRLVELKAAGEGYPLLGKVTVAGAEAISDPTIPPSGQVWVQRALLDNLGIAVGDPIEVGWATLKVGGVLVEEPDRVADAFALGPRVLMNLADLERAKLIQPGSVARFTLLYRSAEPNRLVQALTPKVPQWANVATAKDGLRQTAGILQQAADFMRLGALAGLLIAGGAVAVAAGSQARAKVPVAAIFRCLGASGSVVLGMQLWLALGVALIGGLLGAALGYAIQMALPWLLAGLVPTDLPPPTLLPALWGVLAALTVTLAFALPPLLQLRRVAPVQVLRQGATDQRGDKAVWAASGVATLLIAALTALVAGSPELAWPTLAGLSGAILFFAGGGLLMRNLAARIPIRRVWTAHAVGSLVRGGSGPVLAVACLALGLMAVLVLTLTRADLVRHLEAQVPPNAPDRFLVDAQPDQVAGISALLRREGVVDPDLRPVVRARLTAIDGQPIDAQSFSSDRAQRMAERETNLTWLDAPDLREDLIAGRWWQAGSEVQEISVEEGWAQTLGLKLGSQLTFDAQGFAVQGEVTSIRKVDWGTMRTNFFAIFSAPALQDRPATFIAALRLPPGKEAAIEQELVAQYPNVTLIDVAAVATTLQELVGRLTGAATLLAGFALASSLAVLVAVVAAEHARTARETALLRTLGASRRRIVSLAALRLTLLGLAAAGLGSTGAGVAAWGVSRAILGVDYLPDMGVLLLGGVMAVALTVLVGLWGSRHALRTPPVALLREGA